MPGGRPRKPIEQKIAEGTYRMDRDGPIEALATAEGNPECPDYLDQDAKEFWGQIVPGLIQRRVVSSCDAPSLSMLCYWWSAFRTAGKDIRELSKHDVRQRYQLTILCGVATTNFDRLAAKFGLSPADRAKLRVVATGSTRRVPARKR